MRKIILIGVACVVYIIFINLLFLLNFEYPQNQLSQDDYSGEYGLTQELGIGDSVSITVTRNIGKTSS